MISHKPRYMNNPQKITVYRTAAPVFGYVFGNITFGEIDAGRNFPVALKRMGTKNVARIPNAIA